MKKFIYKVLSVMLILCIVAAGTVISSAGDGYGKFWARITDSESYGRGPTEEITPYIEKAQTKDAAVKLIIGDSVCHQIFCSFQDTNPIYDILGSNQAITIVGQYILAEEFLDNHKDATDIYLVLTSATGTGFQNAGYCYQYFVIPFTQAHVIGLIDQKTYADLTKLYGKVLMNPVVIQLVDHSGLNRKLALNTLKDNDYDNMALSVQYLQKLIDLCDAHQVRLHLIHAPMAESSKDGVDSEEDAMLAATDSTELKSQLKYFYHSVLYYPDEYFGDGVHFSQKYSTEDQLSDIIDKMRENGDFSDFKAE